MTAFRKRPVVVEAWQWIESAPAYPIPPAPHTRLRERRPWFRKPYWELDTLEGWIRISPNDWVIVGTHGEWYLCKPDIFEVVYEIASSEAPAGPEGQLTEDDVEFMHQQTDDLLEADRRAIPEELEPLSPQPKVGVEGVGTVDLTLVEQKNALLELIPRIRNALSEIDQAKKLPPGFMDLVVRLNAPAGHSPGQIAGHKPLNPASVSDVSGDTLEENP